MKTTLQNLKITFLFIGLIVISMNGFAQTSVTFNTSNNFIVPAGVTTVTVEAWGGGAGTGSNNAGGGGGGGAYTKGIFTVTPGAYIYVYVGPGGGNYSAGENSSFGSYLIANGGTSGGETAGGAGGAASALTGGVYISYAGGNGGDPRNPQNGNNNEAGGGGGGSAFATGVGGNGANGGSSTTAATNGGNGTGDGGDGAAADGNPGSSNGVIPGGGGGARGEGGGGFGSGARGRVIVTYGGNPEIDILGGTIATSIATGDSTPSTGTNTSFGAVSVASGTITKTFTIKNTGTAVLSLGAISFSGAGAADFSATTLPGGLNPGSSTTFTVTFDPSVAGTRTAIISIVNNDSNENPYTFTIEGTGNGPEINIRGGATPADIVNGDNTPSTTDNTNFGSADITTGTVAKTFTIQNTGNQSLTTSTITFSGSTAFTVTTSPAASVNAGGTTTFIVTFNPSVIGTATAIISIPNNDSDENPYTFTLTGTGTTTGNEINIQGNSNTITTGTTATATTNNTDFGSQDINAGQVTRSFTIQNLGTASLTVGAISFTGSPDFTVTASPASPISGSGSTTFTVAFDPTTAGVKTATISIVNNDTDENPYTFNITGLGVTAPEANMQGNSVNIIDGSTTTSMTNNTNFGQQNIDGGITTKTFVIQNLGSAALTIGTVTLGGTNAADFSIVTSPAASVAPGSSTTIVLKFDPSAIGPKTATISIVTNDSDENPYNFSLSGTGSLYNDSDGDGITDETDVDDDNDGIIDTQEQASCILTPKATSVYSPFLNETFGAGTTYSTINTTYAGADTNYTYAASGDINDGSYSVRNTAQVTSWAPDYWWTGGDHTGNTNGKMAIFNASYTAGTFYTTTIIGLTPNIPIRYSFWALNLDRYNAPSIGTRIRPNVRVEFRNTSTNALLASLETGALTPNNAGAGISWQNFISEFTTSETSITVIFINNANGGTGNDIALDDIVINQKYCDLDSDGQADIIDLDDDNDGIPDIVEANMRSFSSNKSRMDMETPGKWVDLNGNGLHDTVDGYISAATYLTNYLVDTDGDGMKDFMDLDSDNDSIFDIDEADKDTFAAQYNGDGDIDGDGKGDGIDSDNDGIKDLNDDLPNTYGTTFKAYPADSDSDGIPDYLDTTSNGSTKDIAGTIYANLDTNLDGKIDGTADIDKDGVIDTFDGNNDQLGSPRNITTKKLFINFDGRNDYAEGTQLLSGLSDATIMGWIRLDDNFANNGIAFGQDKFYISVNSSKQLVVTANSQSVTYTTPLVTTRWYHVAATFGGSTPKITLYLNGVSVGTPVNASPTTLAASTSKFTIARSAASAASYFRGFIDEIRVFNKTLTNTQIQRMVYQEIDLNGANVKGAVIPLDIDDTNLLWTSLLGYYRLDNYKNDVIDDYKTNTAIDEGTATTLTRIYNVKYLKFQTAPMPFVTSTTGAIEDAVTNAANYIYGPDINAYPHSIVQVKHDVTSGTNFSNIGLIVDAGKTLTVNNDTGLTNTWYLGLDGKIDLQGRSQLVQTATSQSKATTTGSIERDQQGTTNKYNYNYWSSPVSIITNSTENNGYTVNSVMKNGTNSNYQDISWTGSLDGIASPLTLSTYWIYKFQNIAGNYANWEHVGATGTLLAGQGYTLKGDGAASGTQNYTFVGKPNNGTITSPIAANNLNLSGNPYPSAIDADQFIKDNISGSSANAGSTNSIDGSIYFWEHAPSNNSHILANYKGGYATRNLVGGVAPVVAAGTAGTGDSSKIPGRFIPVGQAFFVVANTTGGQIRFKNSQRAFVKETDVVGATPQSNPIFRTAATTTSTATEDVDEERFVKIRLGFNTHDNNHRQILLGFMNENATDELDYGYDSSSFDDNPSDMYFWNNNTGLGIQGVGSFSDTAILPLGVKSDATGLVQFKLDDVENIDPDQPIYIYDAITTEYHNIRDGVFEITLDPGTFNDRFSLRFTNQVLGINNPELNTGIKIVYAQSNSVLTISNNSTDTTVESASLFNMLGQQIADWDIKDKTQQKIEIPVTNTSTGTYIVKIKTNNGITAKKILIR